jgi:hypothetical protein
VTAQFATASYWYHDSGSGHDRFVEWGATRDSVTDAAAIAANPSLWAGSALTSPPLPAKVLALLAARPRGWEYP